MMDRKNTNLHIKSSPRRGKEIAFPFLKHIFFLVVGGVLLTACASQKRVHYLQDVQANEQIQIAQNYQIRIKPLDRLTIVVNSQDPELAAPFNTASSFNSLTGTPLTTTTSSSTALQTRTVDENGDLEMPVIGTIHCEGLTRSELAQKIADMIREGGYIKDPTVNIQFADMKISVLGEVTRPGQYDITSDRISLLDALSLAGDLTIFGRRSDVMVIREDHGIRTTAILDLTSQNIYESPYFYLQQNDVVYVKPNKYKAQSGEISQNRSFYISLVSTAVSVATLIVTLTK